jgi:YD repeat-containing protein
VFTYLYDGERLAGVRDVSGRELRYGHTSGRLTRVVDAVGNEMTYSYDGAGRMTSKKDINGLEVFVTYRVGSQVASVLDKQGNGDHFQFYYDKNNRQFYSSVRTTGGQTEEKWFNSEGRLIDQVRSGIQGDKVQFDGRNEIITKNTGVVLRRDYDEWGNRTREVRPDGGVVRTEYHPLFHLPTREIDARGAVTLRRYDAHGNLIERIDASGTDIARTNRWEYNVSNRMVRRIDARGNKMDFTYDENDNLIREFDPDNTPYQTFYGYDARGNRTSTTNALGYVTQYGYDSLKRLLAETNALGHVNLYTYTGKNLTQVETGRDGDTRGRTIRYHYDDHGRRTHTYRVDENNVDHIWETVTYDSDGHQIAVANALGQTTRYEYNAAGHQTKVLRPFSATETSDIEYVYDEFGRLEREIDPLGVVTRYEYDELNRNRKVTEAVGTPVQRSRERGYDLTGNLTSITYSDGTNSLSTFYSYDLLGRKIAIRGAREQPKELEYDANDNLVLEINGRGYSTEHRYDSFNRRTSTVEGIGNGESGEHARSMEYDLVGRIVTDYDGRRNHRHYHFDAIGRRTAESIPIAPTIGLPKGGWWADGSLVLNRASFNAWGQLVGTSNIVGAITSMVYDRLGRRLTHTDAAGLTLTNTYDAVDRLVGVHYPVRWHGAGR